MESLVSFSEKRVGEGLIGIAEVRITMIQGFTSPGSTPHSHSTEYQARDCFAMLADSH